LAGNSKDSKLLSRAEAAKYRACKPLKKPSKNQYNSRQRNHLSIITAKCPTYEGNPYCDAACLDFGQDFIQAL